MHCCLEFLLAAHPSQPRPSYTVLLLTILVCVTQVFPLQFLRALFERNKSDSSMRKRSEPDSYSATVRSTVADVLVAMTVTDRSMTWLVRA